MSKCHRTYLLRVHHGNLTDQGANVDEEIEVHVNARGRHDGIDDDTLARLGVADEELCALVLFRDEGRDVRLETTGANAHDDDGDDEACQRAVALLDDTGNRRDDEEDVAEERDGNRNADGLVTTPVRVGDIRAKEGDDINPEIDIE